MPTLYYEVCVTHGKVRTPHYWLFTGEQFVDELSQHEQVVTIHSPCDQCEEEQ
jgi:hypothetical protein